MAKTRAALSPVSVGLVPGIVRFFRDKDASLWGKLFVLGVVAYVVFPADFIPDVIPVVGWLDDLGAVAVAMAYLTRVSRRYRGV